MHRHDYFYLEFCFQHFSKFLATLFVLFKQNYGNCSDWGLCRRVPPVNWLSTHASSLAFGKIQRQSQSWNVSSTRIPTIVNARNTFKIGSNIGAFRHAIYAWRISIGLRNLLFVIFFFRMITNVETVALKPSLDLEKQGYNSYSIELDNNTLQLEYFENGVILYSTHLSHDRQMISISKILDLSEIAVSNLNMRNSMSNLVSINDIRKFEDFYILNNKEYALSQYPLPYQDCVILCASQGALIAFDDIDYFRLRKQFANKDFWVNAVTHTTQNSNGAYQYSMFLGSTMIFPKNRLTNAGSPKIYFQNNGILIETSQINTFYSDYYGSQAQLYWQTAAYKLHARIDKHGIIAIILPTQTMILPVAVANCACSRNLKQSRRLFHEMRDAYHSVQILNKKLNISMESQRLHTGNVFQILDNSQHAELTTDFENAFKESTFRLTDFAPLTITEDSPNSTKSNLIFSAAVGFTAKTVGAPMVLSAFRHFFKKISENLKGKVVQHQFKPMEHLPDSIRLSGLDSEVTNFSLIIKMNRMKDFEGNLSSSISENTRLLKNISKTNQALDQFLEHHAMQYIVDAARHNISLPIDTTYPVIAVIHRSNSFFKFDLYFTCILPKPTATEFRLFPLPHKRVAENIYAVDIPVKFSTDGFHYNFDSLQTESRGLTDCIDQLMAGQIANSCKEKIMMTHRIVKGIDLHHYYIYYIITTEVNAHLKISCPAHKQVNMNMQAMVTVLAISPACALGLNTPDGILTVKRNDSYTGLVRQTFYLFSYNLTQQQTSQYYYFIMLIVVISVVSILVVILIAMTYYFFVMKTTRIISHDVNDTYLNFASNESLNTIQADAQPLRTVSFVETPL